MAQPNYALVAASFEEAGESLKNAGQAMQNAAQHFLALAPNLNATPFPPNIEQQLAHMNVQLANLANLPQQVAHLSQQVATLAHLPQEVTTLVHLPKEMDNLSDKAIEIKTKLDLLPIHMVNYGLDETAQLRLPKPTKPPAHMGVLPSTPRDVKDWNEVQIIAAINVFGLFIPPYAIVEAKRLILAEYLGVAWVL